MKLFDVYPLNAVCIVKGKHCSLWDDRGNEYLDFYGGHAVISIGHSHPRYLEKINAQLLRLGFYSNSVINPLQDELAEKLGALSGYPDYTLFLCNSGAEANENAFKIASFHTGKKKFISLKNSFHGRTSAAVAATDDPSIIAPVNESENFVFIEMNNDRALGNAFEDKEIAGMIVEGIQGVGGIYVPSDTFLRRAQALCREKHALLILDEVQSGYGRTGKFFAHEYSGIRPDIVTVAKGMGNGFPVAGALISPEIKPKHKMLGATFGGNHLACAAATAVLEVLEEENLIASAREKGNYLVSALKNIPDIKEVRGKGLMIGADLPIRASVVAKALLNEHRIFTGTAGNPNTLRLLPPLCIRKEDIDRLTEALQQVCKKTPEEQLVSGNAV